MHWPREAEMRAVVSTWLRAGQLNYRGQGSSIIEGRARFNAVARLNST